MPALRSMPRKTRKLRVCIVYGGCYTWGMRHTLCNETNYSGRALRRAITLGCAHAKEHALLTTSGYKVCFRTRARTRALRIFASGRTIVITVPKTTLNMYQAAGAVAYGMVKCANPDTSIDSLSRVYHGVEVDSFEIPQKKKRKRGKPTLDRKFDALRKAAQKNEDRVKELERQLKRSKTLLKQKKAKLARMQRAFEGELDSTEGLSDNQLAVRLRLAREAS